MVLWRTEEEDKEEEKDTENWEQQRWEKQKVPKRQEEMGGAPGLGFSRDFPVDKSVP